MSPKMRTECDARAIRRTWSQLQAVFSQSLRKPEICCRHSFAERNRVDDCTSGMSSPGCSTSFSSEFQSAASRPEEDGAGMDRLMLQYDGQEAGAALQPGA